MDNPEKLATYIGCTRRRQTKQTFSMQCVGHNYSCIRKQTQI